MLTTVVGVNARWAARPHVSMRNNEAVAALSPQAKTCLMEVLQAGVTRLPRAIEQLRADLETTDFILLTL